MYSNKENVNILTALLLKFRISKAVVCPGSRNSPIVHNLCVCPGIECFPVTDERSAGFTALGMIAADDEPVVVCVTSGSALLNVAPAAAEAYYQNRPLIIVSADRPEQWIGQSDGQTILQQGALSPNVRKSVSLPEPHNDEERWYCNRLVNEALNAAISGGGGPVHINVPISEPLFDYSVLSLPDERKIELLESFIDDIAMQDVATQFFQAKKPMLVLGQMKPEIAGDVLGQLDQIKGKAAVLQEKLADDDICPSQHIDEILSVVESDDRYRPDYIIYMGGSIVSKQLKNFLRGCKDIPSVLIDEWGEVHDTFKNMTCLFHGCPVDALDILSEEAKEAKPSAYSKLWQHAMDKAEKHARAFQPTYSQLLAVKMFHQMMRKDNMDGELVYGNSTAVRLGNIYSDQYIYVNRGVNGIEGTLSTAVGYSVASRETEDVYCVIGDLSFFYDQNALWNQNLDSNLSILLLNNGGGGIFRQLSGLEKSPFRNKMVAAAHETSAKGICEANDVVYLSAHDAEELQKGLHEMFNSEEGPVLLEVFTNPEEDARILKEYYQSCKSQF